MFFSLSKSGQNGFGAAAENDHPIRFVAAWQRAEWWRPIRLITGIAFVLSFVGCIELGLLLAEPQSRMIAVYPAGGLVVAALLRFGWRAFLPWTALAVLAGAIFEHHFGKYFMVAIGNFVAFSSTAWLIERFAGGTRLLRRPENVFRFIACSTVLGLLSSAVGTAVLIIVGDTTWTAFWRHSIGWAVGDVVGVLLVVPLLLELSDRWVFPRKTSRRLEALALFVTTLLVVQFAFGGWPFPSHHFALGYLAIPVLLWAAFRFPRLGGTTVLFVVGALTIADTIAGNGPFALHVRAAMTLLQTYLGAVSMLVLVVAAAVRDRAEQQAALRKALAEAEKARAQAERADRAKSEFLSRMSHELRTPLNAILGFSQLLQLQAGEDESVDECSSHIVEAGRHLLTLINEVMDIASLQDRRLALSLEPVQVPDLVQACFMESGEEARAKGVSCRADFPALKPEKPTGDNVTDSTSPPSTGDSEYTVLADRKRLGQVLGHLIGNAIRFNIDGGQVVVSCRRIEIDHASADSVRAASNWQIRVTDTGKGMSEEDQSRLFTPFERLGAERTAVPGTGLGLTLTKSLVEAMKGRLGAESTVGKGSTFWVELPAA